MWYFHAPKYSSGLDQKAGSREPAAVVERRQGGSRRAKPFCSNSSRF